MKTWNYSILSHEAKQAGGPEAYIQLVHALGVAAGRENMVPILAGSIAVASLISSMVTTFVVCHHFKRKERLATQIETANRESIAAMEGQDNGSN